MASKYWNWKEELHNLDHLNRRTFEQKSIQSPKEQSLQMHNLMKNDLFLIRLEQMTWKEVRKQRSAGQLSTDVCAFMEDSGFKEVLKSSIIKLCEKITLVSKINDVVQCEILSRKAVNEAIDSIRLARIAWEDGINEELHVICKESKRNFTLHRSVGERNPFLVQNLSQSGPADAVKFLFDSEDLLETGLAIRNFNCKRNHIERGLGLINLSMKVLNFNDIATKYIDFVSSSMPQLGMDELTAQYGSKLNSMRHEDAESICSAGSMLDACLFLRRGAPPSLRSKIWRVALGLCEEHVPSEDILFQKLRRDCDRLDLLTDELFMHDIQTVTDDPRFFVFEEELKEVIFCFSRDEWVRHNCLYEIHRPIFILSHDDDENISSPPCGIQPFLGFATYTAPLCYVFRNKSSLYSVSRALFCRLWCKLNVLSSDSDTLLTVCKSFETLLLHSNPKLFLHLVSLGLQPLKIAFPWIQFGFVNLLDVDQVLHLWDRVVGYMDPLLLAVAAVAVFVYRAEALLNCNLEVDAVAILNEGSRLCIIPIIQMLFYKD